MFSSLPPAARALLWVRVLNQLGAYALAFLAVLAGPDLAATALVTFGVAALLSRWGGAFLLERMAPRTVVAVGLSATGTALGVLAVARTPAQLLIGVALVGSAFEIYEPATQELMARVTSGRQRQDTYALLGSSLVAAGAIAGLLAAVLLPLGVRWLVFVDALTCFAAAAVAVAALDREPPSRRGSRERRRWRPPGPLLRLTLASTAFAAGYLAVVMFIPLVLLQRGAPAWLPGLVLAGGALVTPAAVALTRGSLAAVTHVVALVVGTALLGGLALAMAVTGNIGVTTAFYLAWTTVSAMLMGRWQALVAETAPEADRVRWFAFQGSSWGIAQPAVPGVVALVGAVAGGTGPAALVTAGLAFLLVPVVLKTQVIGSITSRPSAPRRGRG